MGDAGELLKKLTNAIEEKYVLKLEKDAKNKEYVSTVSSSSIAVAAPRPLRSATSAANQSQHDLLANIQTKTMGLHDNYQILLRDWLLPRCPPIPFVVDNEREAYDRRSKRVLED